MPPTELTEGGCLIGRRFFRRCPTFYFTAVFFFLIITAATTAIAAMAAAEAEIAMIKVISDSLDTVSVEGITAGFIAEHEEHISIFSPSSVSTLL